jgi:DNA polymerase-3 subunit epsilon
MIMTEPTRRARTGWHPLDGWEPAWYRGTLVGFDLETTGVDPHTARIVTAALVHLRRDGCPGPGSRTWLVDPGMPIPAEASAVHGISTEHARAHGRPAAAAVPEILDALEAAWTAGLPMVVFNAAYDLTLIAAEANRYGLAPLASRPGWRRACIVDPLVIDRQVDRYRRGKRTLQAAALYYRVLATGAHSCDGDAVAACRLARAIARNHPMIGNAEPAMLHRAQSLWYAAWAARFQAYLRGRGDAAAVIDGGWPLRAA